METKGILEKHQRAAAFVVSALLLFVLHQVKGVVTYPFDSSVYWGLSQTSSILDFPDAFRGYVFPALLWPIHALGDLAGHPEIAFRVVASALVGYLLSGPVADFFLGVFGGRLTFERRVVLVVALALIYPGLFMYPLSDLPAVLLVVLSLAAAQASAQDRRWHLLTLAAGAAAYAAYNTRTIYLFSFVALLLVLPLMLHRRRAGSARLLGVVLYLLGAGAVAIPQMLINEKHHGTPTPTVLASYGGRSLMATQLFWGVSIQRYETSTSPKVPGASVFYKDAAGITLRTRYPELFGNPSIPAYIGLVATHPAQFLGIYGRHIVNGMDVRDGVVYSKRESVKRDGVTAACVTTIFCCLLIAFSRKRRWTELLTLAPLLLSVAAIVPGAIETRFFVPVYLVLLGMAVTQFEVDEVRNILRRRWQALALAFIALVSVSFAITGSTMASVTYLVP